MDKKSDKEDILVMKKTEAPSSLPFIIAIVFLIITLLIGGFYLNNKLTTQQSELKTLHTKWIRSSDDNKIIRIVEDMPQIELLQKSTTNLKQSLNDILNDNEHMKKENVRISMELKTMLDNFQNFGSTTAKKIESLNDNIKQHLTNFQYIPQTLQTPPTHIPTPYSMYANNNNMHTNNNNMNHIAQSPMPAIHMMSKVFNDRIPLHTKECPSLPINIDFAHDVGLSNKELEKQVENEISVK